MNTEKTIRKLVNDVMDLVSLTQADNDTWNRVMGPKTTQPEPLGTPVAGAYDKLVAVAEGRGYPVRVEPFDPPEPTLLGQTNHKPGSESIQLTPDMSDAQRTRVLAHELGHVFLHGLDRWSLIDRLFANDDLSGQHEAEAETVAYLVSSSLGLDAGPSSVDYLTNHVVGSSIASVMEQCVHHGWDYNAHFTELEPYFTGAFKRAMSGIVAPHVIEAAEEIITKVGDLYAVEVA